MFTGGGPGWGTKYSSLGNYFMCGDIDTSEIPANRVSGLWIDHKC